MPNDTDKTDVGSDEEIAQTITMTPEEEQGELRDYGTTEQKMREDWGKDVRKNIGRTTIFTMTIIAIALLLDIIIIAFQIDSDPADRLLNTQVILALIAASVAQIGAIAYLIGKSIFK